MLDKLFQIFDNIIIFDLETTGFSCKRDEIIEIAAVQVNSSGVADEFDQFVKLSPSKTLPPEIVNLTGITQEQLDSEGASKAEACEQLSQMIDCSRPLLIAYNAQFDLGFVYYFLNAFGNAALLKKVKMLDALTVYKDRREYPHKLCNAVDAYQLQTQNTHRAIDDAKATYELMLAMEKECDDLEKYINLFGYNPKYGVSGQKISSVTYKPQSYDITKKLYE